MSSEDWPSVDKGRLHYIMVMQRVVMISIDSVGSFDNLALVPKTVTGHVIIGMSSENE